MNVLVIDQNHTLCKNIVLYLKHLNCQCDSFRNPIEGIAAFFDKHYDVVLISAPCVKMGFEEIIKRLQSSSPLVKVLVLTDDNLLEKDKIVLSRCAVESLKNPGNEEDMRSLIGRLEDINYEMAS